MNRAGLQQPNYWSKVHVLYELHIAWYGKSVPKKRDIIYLGPPALVRYVTDIHRVWDEWLDLPAFLILLNLSSYSGYTFQHSVIVLSLLCYFSMPKAYYATFLCPNYVPVVFLGYALYRWAFDGLSDDYLNHEYSIESHAPHCWWSAQALLQNPEQQQS